ncbi:hypothetical protein AGMMS49990_02380 [Endomicrobiia bacterium]|nr:hypothetical protein AGMMS49990_02380 [Endomicrobiia bacterium]
MSLLLARQGDAELQKRLNREYLVLREIYHHEENLVKAKECYDTSESLLLAGQVDAELQEAYRRLGDSYYYLGNRAKAKECLNKGMSNKSW